MASKTFDSTFAPLDSSLALALPASAMPTYNVSYRIVIDGSKIVEAPNAIQAEYEAAKFADEELAGSGLDGAVSITDVDRCDVDEYEVEAG